jgi:hypothetical protein
MRAKSNEPASEVMPSGAGAYDDIEQEVPNKDGDG